MKRFARWLPLAAVACFAASALTLGGLSPASGLAATRCSDFAAPSSDTPSLAAEQVRTSHVSCQTARSVVRYYARNYPASKPGWGCHTPAAGSIRFRCARGSAVIGFILADRN